MVVLAVVLVATMQQYLLARVTLLALHHHKEITVELTQALHHSHLAVAVARVPLQQTLLVQFRPQVEMDQAIQLLEVQLLTQVAAAVLVVAQLPEQVEQAAAVLVTVQALELMEQLTQAAAAVALLRSYQAALMVVLV
jgi:hypothetical protein